MPTPRWIRPFGTADRYESGSYNDPSDDEDDSDNSNDNAFDDEGQLPPEHYLAQAKTLDVSQLRQKRYSERTEEKLEETRIYWKRHCRYIGVDPVTHWRWISDSDETLAVRHPSWQEWSTLPRHPVQELARDFLKVVASGSQAGDQLGTEQSYDCQDR
ncbi:hypothetical protein ACJ73_07994 [Blastomyces percursus]|uniref:Uncharacterized protein n=1 Tax=Blastomyces percursus TaxID=1658174 RepID=A0A1J9PWJ2_9EURO|nr:hypothetical protein ACJ73_07994 [Blastomyces percursus]